MVDGALARVMGWYDNEWGFSNRMSDTAALFGSLCQAVCLLRGSRSGEGPLAGLRQPLEAVVPETRPMSFRTLDDVDVAGKRVLLRADLNVPVRDGKITDLTRIERLTPTIRELVGKGAKVIVCSHFDRPKGKRVPEMSLAPIAAALGEVLGPARALRRGLRRHRRREQAVERMARGDVLVLENTRFHAEEEKNDPAFAADLAKLADIYVNDAFSAAHRAHASTEGVAHLLPAYAGRLMQAELEALDAALGNPVRPVAAIVGGAKVSTKLDLLGNLVEQGERAGDRRRHGQHLPGRAGPSRSASSLQEAEMHGTAREILARAEGGGLRGPAADRCRGGGRAQAGRGDADRARSTAVPADAMILDVGPATVAALMQRSAPAGGRWSGTARSARSRRRRSMPPPPRSPRRWPTPPGRGALRSVAGGGDTVSALRHAGVLDRHELRLDRRRRFPGVAGGQDPARRRRARLRAVRAYLAGPDIFLPEAGQWAERKKGDLRASRADRGFAARPVAGRAARLGGAAGWRRIALQERGADPLLRSDDRQPDAVPWPERRCRHGLRGRLHAGARPACVRLRDDRDRSRSARWISPRQGGTVTGPDGSLRDADGLLIEQFGLFDNLMIEAGILASGGVLVVAEIPAAQRWTDLAVFERCVSAAVASCAQPAGADRPPPGAGQPAPAPPRCRTLPAANPGETAV